MHRRTRGRKRENGKMQKEGKSRGEKRGAQTVRDDGRAKRRCVSLRKLPLRAMVPQSSRPVRPSRSFRNPSPSGRRLLHRARRASVSQPGRATNRHIECFDPPPAEFVAPPPVILRSQRWLGDPSETAPEATTRQRFVILETAARIARTLDVERIVTSVIVSGKFRPRRNTLGFPVSVCCPSRRTLLLKRFREKNRTAYRACYSMILIEGQLGARERNLWKGWWVGHH